MKVKHVILFGALFLMTRMYTMCTTMEIQTNTPPCKSLAEISTGSWSDIGERARWIPHGCTLGGYITDDRDKLMNCFRGHRVGFYGDSTLRQISGVAMNFTNDHFADLGMRVFGGTLL